MDSTEAEEAINAHQCSYLERIDKIISRYSLKYVTIFQISKHGLRPDEVSKIVLRDVDLQRGLLYVRSSKLGADRTIKLKEFALYNLRTYINRKQITALDVLYFPMLVYLETNGILIEKGITSIDLV